MLESHPGFKMKPGSARCEDGAVWLGQSGCQPVGEARSKSSPAEQRVNPSVAGSWGKGQGGQDHWGLSVAPIQPLVRSCLNTLTADTGVQVHTCIQRGPAGRSSEQWLPWGAAEWGCLAGSEEVARMGQPSRGPAPVGA